jgi:spermidine synthase
LTVPIIRALGPAATEGGSLAAVGVTFAALVPLAAVLSGVTPTVARLQLSDLRASGTVVGRLSGWATAGALIGTFGTGFVLVPLMPVSSSILAIGILLVLTGFLLAVYSNAVGRSIAALTLLTTLGLAGLALAQSSPCEAETSYDCIRIEPDGENPQADVLVLNRAYNSDIDPTDPRYLGFLYERWIAQSIEELAPPSKALDAVFVGGGAFTLPRWLQAVRPASRSDVLEVDGGLVTFDRRILSLHTSPSLRATVGDARLTMRREASASADVVVGDAFSGITVPWQLMTTEWMREVKRVLKPGGLYVLNMVDLPPLRLLRAEAATLLAEFSSVKMVGEPGPASGLPEGGNEVLLAANGPLPPMRKPIEAKSYDRSELERIVAGAEPLRDDYAPVDQLETR